MSRGEPGSDAPTGKRGDVHGVAGRDPRRRAPGGEPWVAGATEATGERSLSGRTIVLTGASDGIGRAAAEAYAGRGATVVMVGRNEAKTAAAASRIMSATGKRTVVWEIADLSKQDAVRDLAARLKRRYPRIDVLANNAGAIFLERGLTSEGLERTFALNHLGHFTLSLLLLESLASAAGPGEPARIINVSSRAHQNARLDIGDLQLERGYGARATPTRSCATLFTRAAAHGRPARQSICTRCTGVTTVRDEQRRDGRIMRRVMDLSSRRNRCRARHLYGWRVATARASSGEYWVSDARAVASRADGTCERL
jgi:NAD(P)-dependent dehydrogenase (short-subunit alcohol dehydrogenase family)